MASLQPKVDDKITNSTFAAPVRLTKRLTYEARPMELCSLLAGPSDIVLFYVVPEAKLSTRWRVGAGVLEAANLQNPIMTFDHAALLKYIDEDYFIHVGYYPLISGADHLSEGRDNGLDFVILRPRYVDLATREKAISDLEKTAKSTRGVCADFVDNSYNGHLTPGWNCVPGLRKVLDYSPLTWIRTPDEIYSSVYTELICGKKDHKFVGPKTISMKKLASHILENRTSSHAPIRDNALRQIAKLRKLFPDLKWGELDGVVLDLKPVE